MNEEKQVDKESKAYKRAAGKGIMNLPNKLTLSRMFTIPVFIALFYAPFKRHYFAALAVFAIASLTDLFDGKIARKYGLVTNFGKFLDPIADKVLVLSALVIFLTRPEDIILSMGSIGLIVMGCGVAVILAREIIVSGFRMVAASSGMVIAADVVGKYKTVFQDVAIVVLLIGAGVGEFTQHIAVVIINHIGLAAFAISVILTIVSGINYIVTNIEVLKK